MANHELLVPFIQKWEGGFSNDPADRGGATMAGVTIATYTDYRRKKGMPSPKIDELKRITPDEWCEIFKYMYWDRWRADEIKSQSVADILVDWVWCSGSWGIKIPQQLIGVKPDGVVGPKTLFALNSIGVRTLFEELKKLRFEYIEDICRNNPTNLKFRNGWVNRLNDIKFSD